MRIDRIHIDGFGRLRGLDLKLSEGMNIIYGRNEAGKSTLHAFLLAMLFGIEEKPGRLGQEAVLERYRNWYEPEVYGGELWLSHEGRIYRLCRNFNKGGKDLRILDEADTEIRDPEKLLSELLLSLSSSVYSSTASIGQLKSATGRNMARELKKYIIGLNTTGSFDMDAEAAVRYLSLKKESLEKRYETEATREYASVIGRIKNLESELEQPENENRLGYLHDRQSDTDQKLREAEQRHKELKEREENAGEILKEQGFADRTSIDRAEEDIIKAHEDHVRRHRQAKSLVPSVISGILLVGALLLSAAAFYFNKLPSAVFFALIGASVLLLAGAIAAAAVKRSRQKRAEAVEKELGERILPYLGSSEISENLLLDIHERMEGYRRLYQTRMDALEEGKRTAEEIIELSREQAEGRDDIEKQQAVNREVEEKLLLLNSLRNRASELRMIISDNKRIKNDMDAIDMAVENIEELSHEVRSSLGAYINEEAGRILSKVTAGAYRRLSVSDDMQISVETRERSIPIEDLSMGTMDQVYLALRLSALRLVEGGRDGELPVLFDDSFTLYDDERLRGALSFISGYYKGQILIFTCQKREETVLRELGAAFSSVDMSA